AVVLDEVGRAPRVAGSAVQQGKQATSVHCVRYGCAAGGEEGGREVDVGHGGAAGLAGRYAGAGHDQRHADGGVEGGRLAGGQPVLAHVVAVVGAEHEVGLVGDAGRGEGGAERADEVVDGPNRLCPLAEGVVDGRTHRRGQRGGAGQPWRRVGGER